MGCGCELEKGPQRSIPRRGESEGNREMSAGLGASQRQGTASPSLMLPSMQDDCHKHDTLASWPPVSATQGGSVV